MKKWSFFLLSFFACLHYGISQTELGVTVGTSTPLGAFGGNDLEEGGFAAQGLWAMGELSIPFRDRLGVTGFLSYQTHNLDNVELENAFFSNLPELIEQIRVQPSDYHSFLVMVGPFYEIPLGEKLAWRLKGGGGLFAARLDDQRLSVTIKTENGTEQRVLDAGTKGSTRFSYFLGTALNFDVAPSWQLKLDVTFSGANPELSIETLDQTERVSEQKMTFLNFGVGFVYAFGTP